MRKDYKYRKYDLKYAPPLIELNDPPYFAEDLYELIGSKDFVATFVFKQDSNSQKRFGDMVTGTIFYPKGEREKIQHCIREKSAYENVTLKIEIVLPDIDKKAAEELKYGGVPILDIQNITIVPYRREEKTENGNKKIPVVEIPVSKEQLRFIDQDILWQNMLASKLNAGIYLIPEEKAHLIGITLAINDNRIDTRLIEYLGFTIDTLQTSSSIWYHYYQVKKRRKTITVEEERILAEIEAIDITDKTILLARELTKGHAPGEAISPSQDQLSTILTSLENFRPKVLVPIKRQIWWNAESYLHIVLRHVKDFQLGRINLGKTPFPYDFKQLELLIQKVIDTIKEEIKAYFDSASGKKHFHRNGRMAVYFNGDYYALEIEPDGLLKSIYIVEQVDPT